MCVLRGIFFIHFPWECGGPSNLDIYVFLFGDIFFDNSFPKVFLCSFPPWNSWTESFIFCSTFWESDLNLAFILISKFSSWFSFSYIILFLFHRCTILSFENTRFACEVVSGFICCSISSATPHPPVFIYFHLSFILETYLNICKTLGCLYLRGKHLKSWIWVLCVGRELTD